MLAVHDLGGRGPVLLLVHATGLHGRVWTPVASGLADRFHCLAPDVRGHGESPPSPSGDMAWEGLAADLAAVVDSVGAQPVLGLGHSLGATLLLLAEEARPGTWAGLYCIEPIGVATDAPPPPQPAHPMAARAAARRDDFGSRSEARAAYAAKPPFDAVDAAALDAYVEHGFADVPGGGIRLRCRPSDEAAAFAAGLSHPVYRDLARVAPPVTLAVGERSTVTDPSAMGTWAARLPDGRVEVLAGLGHFAPLEDPAAVARSVARAFAR